VNVSKEDSNKLKEKIRKSLDDGIGKWDAIKMFEISETTYKRYKKKVIQDLIKDYKPQKTDLSYYRSLAIKALEDMYHFNKKIMEDSTTIETARIEASKQQVIAAAQLAKLAEEGYIQPQLGKEKLYFIPHTPDEKVIPIGSAEGNSR
jgi:hypothetical protein